MTNLHLKFVTPERTVFDEEAASVTLPTVDGEITVLPHHTALTALLVPGIIKIRGMKDRALDEVAVSGGFIHIESNGQVMVLADTAERGQELDISVIEQAQIRARQVMREAASKDDVAFATAAAGLERELARFKVAHRHHGQKMPMDRGTFLTTESAE